MTIDARSPASREDCAAAASDLLEFIEAELIPRLNQANVSQPYWQGMCLYCDFLATGGDY